MLDEQQIRDLVTEHGATVNQGRPIKQIIEDGDIPRLNGATVLEGKVSDSVFSETLKTKASQPIRLMFRNNRISTHDVNRGAIPFKDQVLAFNHDHMLNLVKDVLGSSQFDVKGLLPSSTVIPAENLNLIMLENVLRLYMAESSTSTSLYQHWLAAKEQGDEILNYAGHTVSISSLEPNGVLPYLMDTPSTKDKVDKTIDAQFLIDAGVCTWEQYAQIRNASIMAFGMVSHYLSMKGMVLVDTKTEHGINTEGAIVSADELYTMDSSRFWKLDDNGKLLTRDGKPVSFSKEFARGMVKEKDQQFTDEQANEIGVRYIQGLQLLTGIGFNPDLRPRDERIVDSTNLILDSLL
ncbi:MAG: phosphoribosylaminoimidazolesuccinocarboxamide synthase [Gammaproteobacteria bacterium]|nr:phosphoribosylaminoimidazolesuccinocarboxamide synthase [Gammaproteobacteria bacterium]MDD9896017.1 phosphoribosylaminoimidazolesuccinocarboxamide synthase [Gammaproteobacteria bacterium]MDD9959409.1 phosphoribosylaminoimidazolesuccinocarboxamide synthase [Gammaproteobacteria bacterium]